ncbi:sulfatase [Xylophilus sp. Leaf220]|nr:phosphoethanolamine transferase [Xylophilus sp. Leaf220]KQM80250.1 sulfatase [Xylophilus sp. Leaf220]
MHPPLPTFPPRPGHRTAGALPFLVLCAVLLVAVTLGHEGRRVVQLAALAAPPLAWLWWPVRRAGVHRLRSVLVWAWAMGFVLDGAARAYLLRAYQAAPDSSMVLEAAANTTPRETSEYLTMYGGALLPWAALALVAGAVLAVCVRRGRRAPAGDAVPPPPQPGRRRMLVAGVAGAAAISAAAYASKPWRRLHPVAYWSDWSAKVQMVRSAMGDQQAARERMLAKARVLQPTIGHAGPSTVVLVITDSVNRDNMSLYGYGRPTTPLLQAQQAQLGAAFTVFRHAWSVDASTLPALHNLFRFGDPAAQDPLHLIALARAAGYKVWWMTNHDDVGIEQAHARLADEVEMNNRTPGRSSVSLDQEVLDCVHEALQEPDARKLLIVHLMGAHPHYSLRFPEGANPFDDAPDAVSAAMGDSGRPAWLRRRRHEYDAAVLYQDLIVAEILKMARGIGTDDGHRAFMYLSDHGQEVGHGADWAGHSAATAAGYRIPLVVWQNRPPLLPPTDLGQRPFRADWAAWTVSHLLDIRWAGYRPERDVLHAAYRWQAPDIPVPPGAFVQ